MNYPRITAMAMVVAALVAGCSGNETTGPTLTGRLSSTVVVRDDRNAIIEGANAGVTVTIPETPFTTVTDASGHWTINGLPTGTYTVSFTKPGLIAVMYRGLQFVGGGEAFLGGSVFTDPSRGYVTMYMKPTFTITSLTAAYIDTLHIGDTNTPRPPVLRVTANRTSASTAGQATLVICDADPTASTDAVVLFYQSIEFDANATTCTHDIYASVLAENGLLKNRTYHAAVYPGSSAYTVSQDPRTDRIHPTGATQPSVDVTFTLR